MFSGVTGNPLVLFAHGVFPFPHLFYSGLLDVPRCRCYDQHCVETRSAPPLHPHPPAAPQPLSLPACRPFWSPPPAEKNDCHNRICLLLCNCLHYTHTSSLGLMLYSILSAFSLSWRLSIIARSSLEALFWAKDDKRQIGFFTWLSAFQTSRDSKSNASVLCHALLMQFVMEHKKNPCCPVYFQSTFSWDFPVMILRCSTFSYCQWNCNSMNLNVVSKAFDTV